MILIFNLSLDSLSHLFFPPKITFYLPEKKQIRYNMIPKEHPAFFPVRCSRWSDLWFFILRWEATVSPLLSVFFLAA